MSSSLAWVQDTSSLQWTDRSSSSRVRCVLTSADSATATTSVIRVGTVSRADERACTAGACILPALRPAEDHRLPAIHFRLFRLQAALLASPGRSSDFLTMDNSCQMRPRRPVHYQAIRPRPARYCTRTHCPRTSRHSTRRCRLSTSRVPRSSSPLLALNLLQRSIKRAAPRATSSNPSRTNCRLTWLSNKPTHNIQLSFTHSSLITGISTRPTKRTHLFPAFRRTR